MKKIKIITLTLIASLFISCESNTGRESNSNRGEDNSNTKKEVVKVMEEDENKREEKDTYVVYERYSNLDKSKLKYELVRHKGYFYESSNSFVGSGMLDEIPPVDNKKYDEILLSYTFSVELIPIAMKYDEAINYAKSVLPDDIKEERVKFDDESGIFHIIYSSSKGNFVVGLNTKILSTQNGKYTYDKEWISGISYMREIA